MRDRGLSLVIPANKVYAMLGNETLWETAVSCHETLATAGVPHAIVGGVAVCLHGYQRNTVDVDLLIDAADSEAVRDALTAAGFSWNANAQEFVTTSGVVVQFLLQGEKAGRDSEVRLPDPSDDRSVTRIEGLPVLSLSKLIESKIACGQGNVRRTHKDFADVVELIAAHNLSRSFARFLHKSLRSTFRQLVLNARGEQ